MPSFRARKRDKTMATTWSVLKTLAELENEIESGKCVTLYDGYPEPPADWHTPKPDERVWIYKTDSEHPFPGSYALDFYERISFWATFADLVEAVAISACKDGFDCDVAYHPIWMVRASSEAVAAFNTLLGGIEIDL